jgi:hypothetical protein
VVEIIEDPTLKNISKVRHAFFTREGGVSQGCYTSLNCSYACGDNPEDVTENRRRATSYLGFPLESLVTVRNVHGNKCAVVEEPWSESQKPEADGVVTKLPGILLGSDSADCPIVLLVDEEAEVIGLAHAGWQSAKLGIVQKTVWHMVALGARYSHITAVIGPCITQDSYEVDLEFYKQFLNESLDNQHYFVPAKSNKLDHFQFDLRDYVKNCLTRLGLKSVSLIDQDTYSDERFFSCRRARHQGESDFGGHLSCIGLKPQK